MKQQLCFPENISPFCRGASGSQVQPVIDMPWIYNFSAAPVNMKPEPDQAGDLSAHDSAMAPVWKSKRT